MLHQSDVHWPGSVLADGPQPRRVADRRLAYQMWLLQQMPTRDDLYKQRLAAHRLQHRPLFSVITPMYNTPPYVLRRMLASVANQSYPYWEHCLVDDGSTLQWLARFLERRAAADARIRFKRRDENGGIVAASNDALAMASGAFVVLLDHDDEIEPHALYTLARKIDEDPDLDMLYSGLDLLGADGIRTAPHLWPDWSPELLETLPYTAHLSAFRRSIVEEVGGLRDGLDGAQDYDLALRVTERTTRIGAIPDILYHWREGETSTANNMEAKPYAYEAGRRAVSDYLKRRNIQADRVDGIAPGLHRLVFDRFPQSRVSIVVSLVTPSGRNALCSAAAVESMRSIIERTRYPSYELVIAVPLEVEASVRAALVDLASDGLRIVGVDASVGWAESMNLAARRSDGEMVVLFDPALEILTDDWLSSMQGYAQRPAIGAVGPKVYDHDGTIAHAGMVLPRGIPHHLHQGKDGSAWHGHSLQVAANFSALSGAGLMTRRALFNEMSGIRDASSVGYSDVDYCLRLRDNGLRMVFTPFAQLRYRRPMEQMRPAAEAQQRTLFRRQWPDLPPVDPYYNRLYDQSDGQCTLSPF